MFKTVEDLQQMSRSQLEASTQSAAILSRGLQQMAQEGSEFSKKAMEEGSALVGKLAGVKSLEGAVQLQSDYVKNAYEAYVAGARRFGELCTTIAKDSMKPFEGLASQGQSLVKA